MKRLSACFLLFLIPFSLFAQSPMSRRDGFLLLFSSLRRPVPSIKKQLFDDVPSAARGFAELTFANMRGMLDAETSFKPNDQLLMQDALIWLFRTRNVDDPDAIATGTLTGYLLRYPVAVWDAHAMLQPISEEQLQSLAQKLDTTLRQEVHEVSLYGEKFHGKGTAFGETFDMNAFTAAHRTLPYNTLVKGTNIENGKGVVVRINDRGPYVKGRDMDLSVAAFTSIGDRSKGKLRATFERMGDASLVSRCDEERRYQQRLSRDTILRPGIPRALPLGVTMNLAANKAFVLRSVMYPDGTITVLEDWVLPGDSFALTPSVPGRYTFVLSALKGGRRVLSAEVKKC